MVMDGDADLFVGIARMAVFVLGVVLVAALVRFVRRWSH
jgi:hypothetical protein